MYEYDPDVQGLLEYVTFLKGRGLIKIDDPKEFVRSIIDKSYLDRVTKNR
jgi:type VI protein secretion system component VasA